MYRTILSCVAASTLISGCMSAGQHRAEVRDESTDRLTVGTVQREIRVGMAGSGVVQVLGAPERRDHRRKPARGLGLRQGRDRDRAVLECRVAYPP